MSQFRIGRTVKISEASKLVRLLKKSGFNASCSVNVTTAQGSIVVYGYFHEKSKIKAACRVKELKKLMPNKTSGGPKKGTIMNLKWDYSGLDWSKRLSELSRETNIPYSSLWYHRKALVKRGLL